MKYGWRSDSWDDEFLGVSFDSIEDAFTDAQTTFDENAECRDWDYGRHEIEVEVVELSEVPTFNAELVLDDMIDRCGDDGMEEPDEVLGLSGGARATLAAELQAAWDRHVEREKVGAWYQGGRVVEKRVVQFEVVDPAKGGAS